jgi:bifunctional non-homologous end joining protein LigD
VVPYALRALKDAPVAYPMDWEELESKKFDPQKFNLKNIFKRLGQTDDPWKNFYKKKVKTDKLLNTVKDEYN